MVHDNKHLQLQNFELWIYRESPPSVLLYHFYRGDLALHVVPELVLAEIITIFRFFCILQEAMAHQEEQDDGPRWGDDVWKDDETMNALLLLHRDSTGQDTSLAADEITVMVPAPAWAWRRLFSRRLALRSRRSCCHLVSRRVLALEIRI